MIDSHCHINDELYINNPKEYVEEARKSGVETLLVVGFDRKSSEDAVRIANQFEGVYAAVGIHPSDVKKMKENDLQKIEELISNKKVIAIGEIGLDYYWDKEPKIKEQQKEFFIKQIELANKYNLPISIHCRDAYEDTLNILKNHPVKRAGVMHCYSGSLEMSNEFLKLGFVLGIGGTCTFKNAAKPKDIAAKVPQNSYLLETDSPYLTPTPFRGKPNHSKYLCYVRDEIANLKNISPNQVEIDTTNNFKRIFLK